MNVLVGNACGLGKEAWIVFEVKGTGEETTLLQDGSNVAIRASVTCVDVNCFRGSRSGPSGGWWQWTSSFVDEAREVDTVIGKCVVGIGGVIPFHMGELAEVCQIIELEAVVRKKFCNVEMLWSVLGGQLSCMEI